ncbi:hypothetical protein PRIPAC_90197 [Pristionchus pacificus]|uniref:Uncharacterized protein n=1 Tax=Pristionchus pacificus TaxID=54126 RepID=A0A2A6B7A1_PRIPA|nr:hypothetical protein PRIPAC_90197 [Pristionchus pacificus]|eukprot:PDM61748.1 hypothetical protein PRIPAC_51190 [Pristionchus pacificus]
MHNYKTKCTRSEIFAFKVGAPGNMAARPLFATYSDKNEVIQTQITLPVFRGPIRPDVMSFIHDQYLNAQTENAEIIGE